MDTQQLDMDRHMHLEVRKQQEALEAQTLSMAPPFQVDLITEERV
jgi:hypothetical protein